MKMSTTDINISLRNIYQLFVIIDDLAPSVCQNTFKKKINHKLKLWWFKKATLTQACKYCNLLKLVNELVSLASKGAKYFG